jgi:gas vesicle protein
MSKLLFPILAGAAIAAGAVYLFTTEEGEELRGKIADQINEHFPDAGEQLAAFKDQFMENLQNKQQV